ncbi:unnamed protein product [Didymodactylos carnosus]|uniref:Mediator of RNA polymerase II transcription subunit 22 n=1 Tax=Didymodactylos carnosus TaxID=1234261 RepID=A0A814KWE1_9BILA|nr:unnamed protein product [Didymodactylos carnosus]CAF1056834.1 unnamed protein product [Didymodactylos carnosus]CAF3645000.1 unnamed protein product [Didymodactylos carnosus]CAF3825743.1 unnamed protein product [Didymodactylos carnosus]
MRNNTFNKRAKDDLQSILDNFIAIIQLAKVDEIQPNQVKDQLPRVLTNTTDDFSMRVRAANMVRAFESLLKFVSDLKDQAVLYDFKAINDAIHVARQRFKNQQSDLDTKLVTLRDRLCIDLVKFEDEYYQTKFHNPERFRELNKQTTNSTAFDGQDTFT